MYRDIQKRREYIKKYRKNKKDNGDYGKCRGCGCNLGRNEGAKGRNASGYCMKCNYGEVHQNWRGGYINSDGYRVLVIKGRSVLEHRYVMEGYLGRKLYSDETVHHINGIREDNRLDNLELWVGAPVRGIRAEDAVIWAEEIIRRYKL